jgi:hypothetical protein
LAELFIAVGRIIIVGGCGMFCPNCGAKNSIEQNYCRGCGLKLGAIVHAVSEQFPSDEYAEMQRRKERFERIGVVCLSISGMIGFSLLLFKAAQYKLEVLGPNVLFGSAIGALILFLLLSLFFFNYTGGRGSKRKAPPSDENSGSPAVTAKLIEDRPFESASSVTENTTEMLKVPRNAKS